MPNYLETVTKTAKCTRQKARQGWGIVILAGRQFKFWTVLAAIFFAATVVRAIPLTLISHSGSVTTDAQMAGFPLDSNSDSPSSGTDSSIFAASFSETGSGSAHSSITTFGEATHTATGDTNDFLLRSSAFYSAADSGGPRPGGSGSSTVTSNWLFSLNAISVDLTFDVATFLATPFAPSTGTLLVENQTTSETILSLINPAAIFTSSLNFTGSHGDVIGISYSASASVSPGVGANSFNDGADINLSFDTVLVPEPGGLGLFGVMLGGLIIMRRRQRAHRG